MTIDYEIRNLYCLNIIVDRKPQIRKIEKNGRMGKYKNWKGNGFLTERGRQVR